MTDIAINISNKHPDYQIDDVTVKNIIYFLKSEENQAVSSMTLIITTDEKLNYLKKKYFEQDLLTDTISFNLNDPGKPVEGEIYISADRIEDNAGKYNVTLEKEFANVLVHSILHTFGYEDDKEEKKNRMFHLQEKYLNQINYNGLIIKD